MEITPDSTPIDPASLAGLSSADAREYVFRHIAALKELEKEIAAIEQGDYATWKRRRDLAAAAGQLELESAAKARVDELEAKLARLRAEAADLKGLIARMQRQLGTAGAKERSIDADYLVAKLDMDLGGDGSGSAAEDKKTEKAFAAMDLEAQLARMKAEAGMAQAPDPESRAATEGGSDEGPSQALGPGDAAVEEGPTGSP
jgi:TolA-binding protein